MRKLSGFSYWILALAMAAGLSSCAGRFRKLQKSTDVKAKYAGANAFYEEGKYYKASVLYEEILPVLRGAEEGEDVLFKLAYSYYNRKDFDLASHYFQRFYNTYSRSPKAEEANYMYAYCKSQNSLRPSLDQTATKEAAEAMQAFLNRYPSSERKAEATKIIDEMQEKLALKAFLTAKQYYKLQRFKAAVVAFDNFRKSFPDSKHNEEGQFLKIKAEYDYAHQSYSRRQEERYQKVVDFYESFIDSYPDSKYGKEAGRLYDTSLERLRELKSQKKS
ncbi:hypothetical protein FUAX_34670 [Fulvitalea axinellae]|uniref:Outer membrane lipoprotein BamD-like domain-containing protein n=1 Tax=Fulvitalea axinellae TaxID=1182444 RepID=A0AAU9DIR4_9BACT|nr:hypothetical protein FUAX_34670 [Fulvitalea axinellae]